MTVRSTIGSVIARMERWLVALRERGDARRYFHATYLRTTRAVAAELTAGGFADRAWVERWSVTFADLYLDALDVDRCGGRPSRPWAQAFAVTETRATALPPLRHVLVGMNVHINYDLPVALLSVISDAEFADPAILPRRAEDHHRIDRVLAGRVGAEARLATDRRTAGGPVAAASWPAVGRCLRHARTAAWSNTVLLARARRRSAAAYAAGIAELDQLVTARIVDLRRPGPILPGLAIRGFGVRLRPAP